jgi:multiple antibiotic resistance protein
LLGSLLAGSYVLEFFGITLPIVRVAGGFLVAATGWNLLQENDQDGAPDEHKTITTSDAFYPMTMPITVGPGSIAVAITLGSVRPRMADLTYIALLGGAAIGGLVAIAATIYVCYRFAKGLVGMLGDDGTNVVVRLSAFILLCIGIEIIWTGYSALVHG